MAILTKDIDRRCIKRIATSLPITGSNEGAPITMGLIAIVHPGGQPLPEDLKLLAMGLLAFAIAFYVLRQLK
ncbi:MAG: hypothetical protein WBD33_25385 [Xanthobacteraceae bacterium]